MTVRPCTVPQQIFTQPCRFEKAAMRVDTKEHWVNPGTCSGISVWISQSCCELHTDLALLQPCRRSDTAVWCLRVWLRSSPTTEWPASRLCFWSTNTSWNVMCSNWEGAASHCVNVWAIWGLDLRMQSCQPTNRSETVRINFLEAPSPIPKRLQRMLLRLQKYQLKATYHKGENLKLADTLSWSPPTRS